MLIEIWERLRGYDRWVETEAKIKSSDLDEVEVANFRNRDGSYEAEEWQSTCDIVWTDREGKLHTNEYNVSENSPLFQLYDGQSITIRYNPLNPEEFYVRGVLESHLVSALKWKVLPGLLGAGLLMGWLVIAYSSRQSH